MWFIPYRLYLIIISLLHCTFLQPIECWWWCCGRVAHQTSVIGNRRVFLLVQAKTKSLPHSQQSWWLLTAIINPYYLLSLQDLMFWSWNRPPIFEKCHTSEKCVKDRMQQQWQAGLCAHFQLLQIYSFLGNIWFLLEFFPFIQRAALDTCFTEEARTKRCSKWDIFPLRFQISFNRITKSRNPVKYFWQIKYDPYLLWERGVNFFSLAWAIIFIPLITN